MIVHTVMLKFRERAEGRGKYENTSRIRDRFFALKNETNGFLNMQVNMGDQSVPGQYDLIIVTTHRDAAALTQYRNDPRFVSIRTQYEPLIESKAVIDYEAGKQGD